MFNIIISESDNERKYRGQSTVIRPYSFEDNRQLRDRYFCPVAGKTLGKGTFGKVKSAIHIPTGEKVAIKIL